MSFYRTQFGGNWHATAATVFRRSPPIGDELNASPYRSDISPFSRWTQVALQIPIHDTIRKSRLRDSWGQ